jgi:carboxypeptidase T
MKKDYLHTENTTKKSLARARRVLSAFCIVGAITLAAVAFAAGPKHSSGRSSNSQIVAENSGGDRNPIADKYNTLVMRVYFRDRAERDRLAQELNAEEVPTTGGYLTVINNRDLYYSLTARGLRVEIDEKSSRNLSDPQILHDTFYGGYKSVEEIYAFLDEKVAQFPNLVEKIDIGDSWCKAHPGSCTLPSPWNGYDLYVLHITNRNIPGPKPVFWADGDIHAREIATPEVVMRLIDHLLNNYDTDADVHWLLDHHDIWLMPEVNPDGHHIVEAGGGGNSPYYYRKNGDNVGGGGCAWPPTSSNHFGVDNNRNFPFKWGCCGGSSGFVCDQTYRGTSAGSEPEEMAIVNKIRTLVPDQRGPGDTDPAPITTTGVYQNIHTVVPVNLFAWGWTTTRMPNFAETNNIAAHMSARNAGGNGYPFGSIIEQLYPVDGASIDWAYGELGMAAFSTELSGQDFLPSYSCIDNPGCGSSQGIWPENTGMLLYLAKIARTPYLTSHGPDANTVVTNPESVPQGVPSQLTASINFAWSRNAFSQNVGAAEYYIDTPPWAGGTAIPMNGTFNSPTVPVNATINTTSLSVGRHVIFVRGRGVSDFQGFQTWGPISAAFLDVTGETTTLLSAASRLTHGGAGTFEIPMPLTGVSGVEDRSSSTYNAVFTFDGPVSSGEVLVLSGTATVGPILFSGNTMTAQLTGVTSAEVVTLRVQNINGDGQLHGDVPFGFLTADINGNRIVDRPDQQQLQADRGQPITASNFRDDIDLSGTIDQPDLQSVKTNRGHSIP